MKNRNLNHRDDWMTPPVFYKKLNDYYHFDFDPCPWCHNLELWNGLEITWGQRNFVNPPYSQKPKEAFIMKTLGESDYNKTISIMLLPVSTSTRIFHKWIYPNANKIVFVRGRIPFIGWNKDGQKVNFHLLGEKTDVKNCGQHDSMIVVFDFYNIIDHSNLYQIINS